LELLHIDLFGLVSTTSIYESKYGLVIVDAYDVFSNFSSQTQSEKELKILKVISDHGGEFENEPFETFCEKIWNCPRILFS